MTKEKAFIYLYYLFICIINLFVYLFISYYFIYVIYIIMNREKKFERNQKRTFNK